MLSKRVLFILSSIFLLINICKAQPQQVFVAKGDTDYPPFEFLNDKGQPDGFNVEIMNAVAQKMGLNIKIELGQWDKVRLQLENGEIDILLGMMPSEERLKQFDFSIPHSDLAFTVFVRKGSDIKSFEQTKNRQIIVQSGDLGHDYLIENNISDKIFPAETVEKGLIALSSGMHDCAVMPRLPGIIALKNKNIKNIESVGAPVTIVPRKYGFAVTKGNSELLAALNEGLAALQTSGQYDEIYQKWVGVYEYKPMTTYEIIKNMALVIVPLLLIIFLTFYWNFTLKKQVAKRTSELYESKENLQITLNSIGDAVIATDIDGRVTQMNPIAEKLTGWPQAQAQGKILDEIFNIINTYTRLPVSNPVDKVLADGEIVGLANHTILIARDKTEYQIADSAAPIHKKNGEIIGVVLVFRDVTQEYQMRSAIDNEHKRFSAVLNAVDAMVLVTDTQNQELLFLNDFGKKICTPQQDDKYWKVFLQSQYDSCQFCTNAELIEKCQNSHSPYVWEFKNSTNQHWYECHDEIIQWPDGRLARLQIATDITKRKEMEQELRENERKLSTLFKNLPGIAYRCKFDQDWTMEFISDGCIPTTGYNPEELVGNRKLTYNDLILPEDRKSVWNKIYNAIENKTSYQLSYRIKTKCGQIRWLWEQGSAISDDQGQIVALEGYINDFTELKLAQEKQQTLMQTLEIKNNELESIVNVTSHDLRSPLVNIQGFSGELNDSCQQLKDLLYKTHMEQEDFIQAKILLNEHIPESLKFISAGVTKISNLLNGLLQVSRIGTAQFQIENINANAIIADVRNAMEYQIKKADIQVNIASLPDCQADAAMLNQIFTNLMGNALKYLDPNRQGTLEIKGYIKDNYSIYSFCDNGIGIDPKYHERIFEMFHRLNPKNYPEGEGLGLTIIMRLLDRMNGRIWLESQNNHGTTFFVALPATK